MLGWIIRVKNIFDQHLKKVETFRNAKKGQSQAGRRMDRQPYEFLCYRSYDLCWWAASVGEEECPHQIVLFCSWSWCSVVRRYRWSTWTRTMRKFPSTVTRSCSRHSRWERRSEVTKAFCRSSFLVIGSSAGCDFELRARPTGGIENGQVVENKKKTKETFWQGPASLWTWRTYRLLLCWCLAWVHQVKTETVDAKPHAHESDKKVTADNRRKSLSGELQRLLGRFW